MRIFFIMIFLGAAIVGANSNFTPLTLSDQFGKIHRIDGKTCSLVLVTAEKTTAHDLKTFIRKRKGSFLQKHRVCILFDIRSIPAFVIRWFLLPKMRRYPFEVLLLYDNKQNVFPTKKGFLTVIRLKKNNEIESIRYFKNPAKIF